MAPDGSNTVVTMHHGSAVVWATTARGKCDVASRSACRHRPGRGLAAPPILPATASTAGPAGARCARGQFAVGPLSSHP
ncbi:hypothetical protein ACU4GD_26865 [Cupriavidus basilensis]